MKCGSRGSIPVWLKNSIGSRRMAIIVAQQPTEAVASSDLTAVALKVGTGYDELVGEALMRRWQLVACRHDQRAWGCTTA